MSFFFPHCPLFPKNRTCVGIWEKALASMGLMGVFSRNPMSSPAVSTISIPIHRPLAAVYEYAANPENLPSWAAGLCRTIRQDGDAWVIDTPDGPVGLRFVETNAYGVLDHCVSLAPGVDIHVPMRVVAHEGGSVVMLTLFRLPGVSDEEFTKDEAMVRKDLLALKAVLEALPAKG